MSLSGAGKLGAPTCSFDPRRHAWYPPTVDTSTPLAQGHLMMNNTLTGSKQAFVPVDGRTVRWYTCGPTVYDSSHVGHARTYLSLDIMRRIMTDYFHYNVLYHVNITDIDDKIIMRARQNVLIENLIDDATKNGNLTLDEVKAMIGAAVVEAGNKLEKKRQQIEEALKEATKKQDSRLRIEQEGLLDQQKLKVSNLESETAKIDAALKDTNISQDAKQLIMVSKSVLADKLDAEKGQLVTDHSVFIKHARYYEKEFMEDMEALGIREPDVLTRVTEYMPQIIVFIEKIVQRSMAYESNGSVYLSLDAFQAAGHNYRKLSPAAAGTETSAAELAESEGALSSGSEKRNPNDFALWKSSKPGEPAWGSPWGPGRPGWHIECSAVASDILGENLDIHSGGEDLKFPHHDNELAQSEACLGACCGGGRSDECHQWVNYFTHTGHLHIEGLKMSKSLKNFVTIREALEKNSPRLLRILFLMQGWDQPMNYSQQTTDDARSKETTFKAFFRQVEALARGDYLADEVGWRMGEHDRELSNALLAAQKKVHESLLDNFNTKEAMLALLQVISQANIYLRIPDVKPAVLTLKSIAIYVTQILKVFGVVQGSDDFGFEMSGGDDAGGSSAVGPMIDALVSFRTKIRDEALSAVKNSKDDPSSAAKAIQAILETCDALRDEILPTVGIRLEDRPEGTLWNREDPATMMKELEEKKAREAELRKGKIEKKLVAKEKELAKLRDSLQVPDQMFRTDEFKEWDEMGVPTVNADGTPVGAGQIKKKKKAIEKQMKMYEELMSKADKNPQSLLDATEAEVKKLQEELAALSI